MVNLVVLTTGAWDSTLTYYASSLPTFCLSCSFYTSWCHLLCYVSPALLQGLACSCFEFLEFLRTELYFGLTASSMYWYAKAPQLLWREIKPSTWERDVAAGPLLPMKSSQKCQVCSNRNSKHLVSWSVLVLIHFIINECTDVITYTRELGYVAITPKQKR